MFLTCRVVHGSTSGKLTPVSSAIASDWIRFERCRCTDAGLKRKILRDHFPNVAFPDAMAACAHLDRSPPLTLAG